MKTCPVCHAVAFDDATTCFGCMHRFDTDPYDGRPLAPLSNDDPFPHDNDRSTVTIDAPLSFLVSLTPVQRGDATTWTCSIETAAI